MPRWPRLLVLALAFAACCRAEALDDGCEAPDARQSAARRTPQSSHVLLQSGAVVSRKEPVAERRAPQLAGDLRSEAAGSDNDTVPLPDITGGNTAIQTGFVVSRSAGPTEEDDESGSDSHPAIATAATEEDDERGSDNHPANATAAHGPNKNAAAAWLEGRALSVTLARARWQGAIGAAWHKLRNTTLFQNGKAALKTVPESTGGIVVILCVIGLIVGLVFFSMASFAEEDAVKDRMRPREEPTKGSAGSKQWAPPSVAAAAGASKSMSSLEAASVRSLLERPVPEPLSEPPSPMPGQTVPRPLRQTSGVVPRIASLAGPPALRSNLARPAAASAASVAATTPPVPPAPAIGEPQATAGQEQSFCPSLVVPSGMEFIFAVRQVLTKERQMTAFSVVDLRGQPLSHVIANEKGAESGIYLQTLNKTPLAMVRTGVVHERPGSLPEICRPSGEVFCTLVCDGTPNCGRYLLRHSSGQHLLTFAGDFREKATNVVNTNGRLVCATERCHTDFDGAPHYQVRVAPHVDAGLVLCGLLAIDKLEGSSREGAAGTTFADIA